MAQLSIKTQTTTKSLIDPLDKTQNASSFQRARIVGDKFAERDALG